MKASARLSQIKTIKIHDKKDLYYINETGHLYSFENRELIAQNVYDFRLIKDGVVYTQSELGDLFIITNEFRKVLHGFFYLSFFKVLPQYYVIVKN